MKIAIVTGASSGLGREFVRQLHKYIQPDEIWAIARRRSALEALSCRDRNSRPSHRFGFRFGSRFPTVFCPAGRRKDESPEEAAEQPGAYQIIWPSFA